MLRAVPSRLGVGIGIGICEDFWHLPVPQLLALDGAQILINVSSSPGRDLAATNEVGPRDGDLVADAHADLRPADDLVRHLLQSRRGRRVDLVLGRLGGHRPERAGRLLRAALRRGPVHGRDRDRRHPARADRPAAAARRTAGAEGARAGPDRRRAGRAGGRFDRRRRRRSRASTWPPPKRRRSRSGSGPTASVARTRWTAAHDRDRTARATHRSSCRPSSPSTPTSPAASSPSSSAASSSRRASSRLVLGLSGGIDSAVVAFLVAEAIGADRLLAVMMPYRTSSPASRADAEIGHRRARLPERARRDHADGRRLLRSTRRDRPARTATRPAARQLRGADADVGPVRPVGDVRRAGRRDRQQDRVAHRLHDVVRRLGLGLQPDRRPVQEPGPPARRRHGRPRRDRAQGRRPPTCGPARPTRPRADSATRCSIGCCSGGSTSGDRSTRWSSSGSTRRWSSGSTGWSPAPSSSGRSRRSPSSGRGRRASTTSTRAAGRGRPAADDRGGERAAAIGRVPAGRCTSSPPRSATSATSRSGRSRSSGPCRSSRPRTRGTRTGCSTRHGSRRG